MWSTPDTITISIAIQFLDRSVTSYETAIQFLDRSVTGYETAIQFLDRPYRSIRTRPVTSRDPVTIVDQEFVDQEIIDQEIIDRAVLDQEFRIAKITCGTHPKRL